jgi:SAM-dependent methyltransferase
VAATVHAAVPAGASILELGCGTGRILRPLAGHGHRVHGVDDSAGMLARLSDLPVTCAPIESLRLDETFCDAELTADLAAADLAFGRWLTADHTWFTAEAA